MISKESVQNVPIKPSGMVFSVSQPLKIKVLGVSEDPSAKYKMEIVFARMGI